MLAYQLSRPSPIESSPLLPVDLPLPEPAAGEVRVRVRACGVCHTDLHIAEGEVVAPKLPIVPGHQVVGVVDARGPGAARHAVGDRVGIPWLYDACGECRYCRRDNENLCDRARFTGLHADGGYAEYTVVREDFAYRLPEGVPDIELAPLLCAGVIGYRSFRLSGVERGDVLGLYGFGASAHIVIQIARHRGCRVFVFTRGDGHRRLARRLGAEWVGSAEDAAPAPLDGAIVFAPAGGIVPLALRALRKGGAVALAGIYMTPIPAMEYSLLYGERTLRTVANSTRRDVRDLLDIASEAGIRTDVQRFPLAEANRALQLLKASRIDGAAVLEIS